MSHINKIQLSLSIRIPLGLKHQTILKFEYKLEFIKLVVFILDSNNISFEVHLLNYGADCRKLSIIPKYRILTNNIL